jgi:hypothetical protein
MKLTSLPLPFFTLLMLAISAPSLLGQVEVTYFDTGLSPDGGYPSIWGKQMGAFTPAHDMLINQASTRAIPDSGASGDIASVEFFLNGALIARGISGGFVNGQPTPAIFSQPVFLSAGVTYQLEVDTSGYLDMFHSGQITTSDGVINNISAIDANNHAWIAFPSLVLAGPVPEPSTTALLLVFGSGAFVRWRARNGKSARQP